jgi:outer membrane receptor protein involved in Fe transport
MASFTMKTTPHHKNLIAMAVTALISSTAWSQNGSEGSLNEIQVINTSPLPGIGIEKNKLPYEVQSVDSKTLKNSNSLNITEFMNDNLNGVNVNDIQGSPYQADVTYRGSRASATLGAAQGLSVYMDGVRVNEPFGDVVNWDMLPEAAFESVTLVPGSNPIYGLNTLGGALAFTTKSGLTTQGNELGLTLGSYGRVKVDVTHGSKSADGWHRFVAASAFHETGWRDYSAGNLNNLFVKVGRTQEDTNWDVSLLNGNSKLVGNGLTPSTNYGEIDSPSMDAATPGLYDINRKSVYSYPDETQNNTSLLTFNLQRILDKDTELATTAYIRYGKQNRLGGDVEWNDVVNPAEAEGVLRRSNTSQTSFGLSTNLTKVVDIHQVTGGASLDMSKSKYGASNQQECHIDETRGVTNDCQDDDLNTAGVRGSTSAIGLFMSDTMKIGNETYFTLAGRYNQTTVRNTITNYDGNGIGTERSEEKFTYRKFNPSFGLSHKLDPQYTFFGNWSQSNRAPTVIELGCADLTTPCLLPTGLQADPYLKQVVAQTLEAGVRWKGTNKDSLAISVYQTNNSDDILFVPFSDPAQGGNFKNFDKTRYQGIDISLQKTWGDVHMSTAYSYLKATYQATGELLAGEREMHITPGMRLPGLPLNTLKVNLDWQASPQWNWGVSMHYVSSMVTQGNEDGVLAEDGNNDPVAGDVSIKGHALLNLNANYQATKGLTFFGKILNVTNKRYETYGLVGQNNFTPTGGQIDGSTSEPTVAKFVAPGAPRTLLVGMRYQF